MRSKQAKLGFQVLTADSSELRTSTKEDFEERRRNKEYNSYVLSKQRKLRWWNKNKEWYNAKRRAAARTIAGRYEAARRKALLKEESWDFTPDSWERAWQDAGWVLIPGSISTQRPEGTVVPAFALRGNHTYKNTCMQRIDLNKGWSPKNCTIIFRGEELGPSNQWYRRQSK